MGIKGFNLKTSPKWVTTGFNMNFSQACRAGNDSLPPNFSMTKPVLPNLFFLFWTEGVCICLLPPPAHKDRMNSFYICYELICFNRTIVQLTSFDYLISLAFFLIIFLMCVLLFVTINKIILKKCILNVSMAIQYPFHTLEISVKNHINKFNIWRC